MRTPKLTGLVLCMLLACAGCPGGKAASVNWAMQPHQGAVPRPSGAWAVQPALHANLMAVYSYPGATVPAWILAPAAAAISPAIDAELAWSRAAGVPRARTTGAGNIEVWLYYDPRLIKSTSTVTTANDCIIIAEDGKSASGVPALPVGLVGGQTMLRQHGDTITSATVWINVAYLEASRLSYVKSGKIDAEARRLATEKAGKTLNFIAWHEGGHALYGLTDDAKGTASGLMVYKAPVLPFSAIETDVIKWLYGVK